MVTTLGSVILDALDRLQKNQFWLAEAVGVSPQAVTKWIQTGQIRRENAKAVAEVLGLSIDTLLGHSKSDEAQIGQVVEALPDEHRQQVLDFIQYKIEKSEAFMTTDKIAHYLKLIDNIKADMRKRSSGDDGSSEEQPPPPTKK